MYSVTAEVGELWRRLLLELGRESGTDLEWLEHPAPAPLEQLWQREDQAAVFMCGLPLARGRYAAQIVAAPVPSPPAFQGLPCYWSELVVRRDSSFAAPEDTFGRRIAFTVADSQSGFAAPLNFLRAQPGPHPRYEELIAPQITPRGALQAVIDGVAEIAPVDSYAFALFERHCPQLTAQVRILARTAPTAIPPLVASPRFAASPGSFAALQAAFLEAHRRPDLQALMQALLLQRFVVPERSAYDRLSAAFEESSDFWRLHPLARIVHPAFL